MVDESYKEAYEKARRELDELTEQREAIDRRMAKLKQIITGLEPLAGPDAQEFMQDVLSQVGLKDACLDVLRLASKPLTPSEVVRQLRRLFRFDMDYANPVAVVTTTLKRSKEVMEVERPDGKKAYLIRSVEAIRNFAKERVEAKKGKR